MLFNNYIDYTKLSRFSGSGLRSDNELYLENGSTTGTSSPGYYAAVSGDNKYWKNNFLEESQSYESQFLLTFERPSYPPTGDITILVIAKTQDQESASVTYFDKLTLWYLKENNPWLSQDYLVASGLSTLDLDYQTGWHEKTLKLQSEPYNNYSTGVNGYLSLSGAITSFGIDTSGTILIDSIYLGIDGGPLSSEQSINCTLINSTLYTKTYNPNTDSTGHVYNGSGLNQDGLRLQFLSPANFIDTIKDGAICSSNNSKYWTYNIDYLPFANIYHDFEIVFNKLDIVPTGRMLVNYKYEQNGTFGQANWTQGSLWARKGNNPSLSSDVQIASTTNNQPWNYAEFNEPIGSLTFTVLEGNRSLWLPLLPNLMVSFSGRIDHAEQVDPLARWKISGMEFMASGTPVVPTGEPVNNNFTVFMEGHSPANSGFNMTVWQEQPSGDMTMYMVGHIASTGNFNMYLTGSITSSGQFDMYTYGHNDTNNYFNIFLKAPPTGSGLGGTDMYMVGPSFLPSTGILPMVVYYDSSPVKMLDMFIQNSNISSTGMFNIYIEAPSGTLGAVPLSGIIPMYIGRTSEGIDAGINMYIGGPTELYSGIDLYIAGTNSSNQAFDIVISGGGPVNTSLNLFTHGF